MIADCRHTKRHMPTRTSADAENRNSLAETTTGGEAPPAPLVIEPHSLGPTGALHLHLGLDTQHGAKLLAELADQAVGLHLPKYGKAFELGVRDGEAKRPRDAPIIGEGDAQRLQPRRECVLTR